MSQPREREVGRGLRWLPAGASLLAIACSIPSRGAEEPEPAAPVVDYVSQQEILVALPMRVRLPSHYGAERVLVFFRTWGTRNWQTMELLRAGQTWTGEVSCREVSTVTGDTRYFFLAFNDDGEPVVGSGSPDWPHVATVVRTLPEGPAALAGESAPIRCHDVADCPPDFPGCPPYSLKRPTCNADKDCTSGQRCAWDGYCETQIEATQDPDPNEDDEALLAKAIARAKTKYKTIAASRTHWPWSSRAK